MVSHRFNNIINNNQYNLKHTIDRDVPSFIIVGRMLLEMIQWEAEILHFKKNEHRKKQLQTIKLNLETNDADIERNSRTDKQQIYIDRNFLIYTVDVS